MSGKETMRARERVEAAIRHRQPDRMPIDLGMYTASGISAFAYRHLRAHLGLSTDRIELYEEVQCLARVDEDVLERLHADCILLRPRAPVYRTWCPRGDYRFLVPDQYQPQLNEHGEWVVTAGRQRMRMPPGGYFLTATGSGLKIPGGTMSFRVTWQRPSDCIRRRTISRPSKACTRFSTATWIIFAT